MPSLKQQWAEKLADWAIQRAEHRGLVPAK